VRSARSLGLDLIGEPRLVRLNPNVPTKTRGNAALVARFGHGRGAPETVGLFSDGPVECYRRGRETTGDERHRLLEELWSRVQATSASDPGTDPALVLLRRRPPAELYWAAVRRLVTLEEVHHWLAGTGAEIRSGGSGNGLIGAAAALAWPARRATWEAIAYRRPDRWGTDRTLDGRSLRATMARHPRLFLCTDRRSGRILVAPHTSCPILFGLRATDPETAVAALREIRSEPIDRWMLFRTNQGTGDHVRRPWPLPPVAFTAGTVRGRLAEPPTRGPGGHVFLALEVAGGARVRCAVFEPTKTLPAVARALVPGDRVRLWGGSHGDPVFRVEGIDLLGLAPRVVPEGNPRCPDCRTRLGSLGAGRGFRCPRCRRRAPPEARRTRRQVAEYPVGRYHPTPGARRHLAPLGPE
jgi:tRNA(Ile2)-agmatinylcytidine synthase